MAPPLQSLDPMQRVIDIVLVVIYVGACLPTPYPPCCLVESAQLWRVLSKSSSPSLRPGHPFFRTSSPPCVGAVAVHPPADTNLGNTVSNALLFFCTGHTIISCFYTVGSAKSEASELSTVGPPPSLAVLVQKLKSSVEEEVKLRTVRGAPGRHGVLPWSLPHQPRSRFSRAQTSPFPPFPFPPALLCLAAPPASRPFAIRRRGPLHCWKRHQGALAQGHCVRPDDRARRSEIGGRRGRRSQRGLRVRFFSHIHAPPPLSLHFARYPISASPAFDWSALWRHHVALILSFWRGSRTPQSAWLLPRQLGRPSRTRLSR